jgi:uncharacterized protein YndB with AHSA1/START domain
MIMTLLPQTLSWRTLTEATRSSEGTPTAPPWDDPDVEIVRDVEIHRPIAAVFAFVSDPRNDPRWCRKVRSVEQVEGDGPGPGARYAVMHRPIPLRPARRMELTCTGWSPPRRVELREDDGTDIFLVTYELDDLGGRTRITQRSDAALGAPRLLHPVLKAGIGGDMAGQLKALKKLLEG